MIDSVDRTLEIIFVKDQKQFIQIFIKKQKCDYLLNVNKIIKEKFDQDILVPNKIQSFLINYEIKKLIDKAINVRNRKYNRIIYVNAGLSASNINNTVKFLNTAYTTIDFVPHLIDSELEIGDLAGVDTIKKGQ
ncbi:hypothetical protein UFOVP1604_13 [uncultured Caudovirales phage]|jgi:hypothetical protein|uniref:Uncharacterized protein n=1 Tax=uncultured Caudovirales phage TaxID=2100421 RepID=A0A6J5SV13_9CAUD|nr:hypothetical protein UFOVP1604_13 [uncultured Caudovirales phage]